MNSLTSLEANEEVSGGIIANNPSLLSIKGMGPFDMNGAINLVNFEGFYLSENLDLSKNIFLNSVDISSSNLLELDLSNNTEITELSLHNIGLECVQVHDTSWAYNIPLLYLDSQNPLYFSENCNY